MSHSPVSRDEALAECRRSSGLQFWPEAVRAPEAMIDAGAVEVPDRGAAVPAPALAGARTGRGSR